MASRRRILEVLVSKLRVETSLDLAELARLTPGYALLCIEFIEGFCLMGLTGRYVGADLSALTKEAAAVAINRIFKTFPDQSLGPRRGLEPHELDALSVEMGDFLIAVKRVQPSAKREGSHANLATCLTPQIRNCARRDVGRHWRSR